MTSKVKAVKDKNMSDMFNQMLGTGDTVNMNIVYKKYLQMEEYSQILLEIIEKFAKSPFLSRYGNAYSAHSQMMLKFCTGGKEQVYDMYSEKISKEFEWNPDLVDEETKKRIATAYKDAKTNQLTSAFITLCDKLVIYRKYLQDENKLSHRFILNMPDMEFSPFPFAPTLNLKEILMNMEDEKDQSKYSDRDERLRVENINKQLCEYCMVVLHKLYKITYSLYQVITSPDIDVDEFVNVIIGSIDQIKHQPNLSRCDKAFNKIKESVGMLKENFSNYYKDFLETKNSTIIMENFILDVSNNNTKSDPQLMQQFRKIISHYRTLAKNNIQNPQLRALFDQVNTQFSQAENQANNIVNIQRGKLSEYIDPEDQVEAATDTDATSLPTVTKEDEFKEARERNANKSVDEIMQEMGLSDKKSKKGKRK